MLIVEQSLARRSSWSVVVVMIEKRRKRETWRAKVDKLDFI